MALGGSEHVTVPRPFLFYICRHWMILPILTTSACELLQNAVKEAIFEEQKPLSVWAECTSLCARLCYGYSQRMGRKQSDVQTLLLDNVMQFWGSSLQRTLLLCCEPPLRRVGLTKSHVAEQGQEDLSNDECEEHVDGCGHGHSCRPDLCRLDLSRYQPS